MMKIPLEATPKHRLRRADLKTGILLGALSGYMLYTAFGYPLEESYGGVENSWYVSPALLPILIAGLLLFFAVLLTINALRYAAANRLRDYFFDWRQFLPGEKSAKTFLILLFIGVYTYVLIERIDFVIATSLFLFGFIGAFYACRAEQVLPGAIFYLFLGGVVWAQFNLFPDLQSAPYYLGDVAGLIALGGWFWCLRGQVKADAVTYWRLRITLATSITTALVIGVSFRFGLLVPLPNEGCVLEAMHLLRGYLR